MDLFQFISSNDIAEEGMFISTKNGRQKVSENLDTIEKGIKMNLEMVEKSIPVLNNFIDLISKPYDKSMMDAAKKFKKVTHDLDFDRASDEELMRISKSYMKKYFQKTFNKADFKSAEVSEKNLELIKKCSEGGEYNNRFVKVSNEMGKIGDKLRALYKKNASDKTPTESRQLYNLAVSEMQYFAQQTMMTGGDMMSVSKDKSKPAKEGLAEMDNIPKADDIMQKGNEDNTSNVTDVVDENDSDDDIEDTDFDDEDDDVSDALESVLTAALESPLTAAERRALPDNVFGLPEKRQFPLDTEERVKSAISYFRYSKAPDRKELATNIIKRMKALHMTVEFGSKLVISKYVPAQYVVDNNEREENPSKKK